MLLETPLFLEDTSMNGLLAVRLFAFGSWKHLLKEGSQRLKLSLALFSELDLNLMEG